MTYALLSMSERHGLLAGIMCAGASPVPACAELTQPPAWFFAAVARPCLWAVGVQLPPHLAASASCCVTWRCCVEVAAGPLPCPCVEIRHRLCVRPQVPAARRVHDSSPWECTALCSRQPTPLTRPALGLPTFYRKRFG